MHLFRHKLTKFVSLHRSHPISYCYLYLNSFLRNISNRILDIILFVNKKKIKILLRCYCCCRLVVHKIVTAITILNICIHPFVPICIYCNFYHCTSNCLGVRIKHWKKSKPLKQFSRGKNSSFMCASLNQIYCLKINKWETFYR